MYSYITQELPDTVFKNFSEIDAGRVSITGHSMGGHGALSLVRFVLDILPFYFYSGKKTSQKLGGLVKSQKGGRKAKRPTMD